MRGWARLLKDKLRATRQGAAICLCAPQTAVEVRLETAGWEADVTENSAIAALRPLTVRIGLPYGGSDGAGRLSGRLHFIDRERATRIGLLRLKHLRDWSSCEAQMALHEVVGGSHLCASRARRGWDTLLYRRAARATPEDRRVMTAAAIEWSMVFYCCPRPVYFVSVDDGRHSNLFPMDLIGSQQPGHLTLALRNTSPSVETIKSARRLALGDVPGDCAALAYELGKHHKTPVVDWGSLPFPVITTPVYGLRLPQCALRVREVQILDHQAVGSHTLFLGKIASDQGLKPGPRLFHTSGAYQALRRREGRAFEDAPTAAVAGPVGKR